MEEADRREIAERPLNWPHDVPPNRPVDLTPQIAHELYAALERLGTDPELLAIVGSWRDTLDDAEVLSILREYNATGRLLPQ